MAFSCNSCFRKEHNNQVELLVTAAIGLTIGILCCWLIMRGRITEAESAASAKGKAEVQIELAAVKERVRSLEEDRRVTLSNHEALERQAELWRDALGLARDESSKLTERASRVATLEALLIDLRNQQETRQDEVLRLSTSEAEKVQALALVTEQLQVLEGKIGRAESALETAQQQVSDLRENSGRINAELKAEREGLSAIRLELQGERAQRQGAEELVGKLTTELAETVIRLQTEQDQSKEKLGLLLEAKQALTDEFKNLAAEILEEKSKRFSEQNQTSLGLLLDPLKVKIAEFQSKVEDVYVKEGKDRTALSEQVRQLMELNQSLSQDAKNLTRALKGSSKTQGNWGELILQRVLEASGLRKGEEYDVQESHTRDDGSRAQPDVVIHLPEDRHLVVDAKVSLTAYEEFSSSEEEADRLAATKRHMASVRAHMKSLSERNYQALYGLKSLDFVLMFVPVEPAFMLALSNDRDLFMDALQKNVLLVSPSTLLFVVRTVAHLWRQEAQSRNAQEIARRGAELYDKLVGFVEDLESLGNRLKQAQKEYDAAHSKLTAGRGNVIRQAEMLRDLGVKPSKVLPPALVDIADDGVPLIGSKPQDRGSPDLSMPTA